MALKKLPLGVQSKFSASKQINTFKAAIEELVYNAFDADSTSIAVRIHIQENFIQVVDNGHGVDKNDFNLLGERYSTSKYEHLTAKSNPRYGCCGQTLANIVEASESVIITSRCKDSDEAWVKCFYKGKQKDSLAKTTRPSVGTTVEIWGFLHNMPIQRKSIKALQELQQIKAFLGQMSVVHCDASISLRDNAENEIIFKIHKNRDVSQTLTSILGIDITDFQELQVEKNQYKVTGFIQKGHTESNGTQWIYLNKRIIDNSKLHKIVNQNLSKTSVSKKILKVKIYKNDEDKIMTNNKLPDYFIFITCPRDDYDIISNQKQCMLEFKNLNLVNKMLEKLIQFFNGSLNLEKKSVLPIEKHNNDKDDIDIRNQVKQIMDKILGSYQRKHNGSQLHNGVKGKIVKRKMKRSLQGIPTKLKIMKENNLIPGDKYEGLSLAAKQRQNCSKDNATTFKVPKKTATKKHQKTETAAPTKPQPQSNKPQNNSHTKTESRKTKYKKISKTHPIITKFEKKSDEVKNRCHMLAKQAKNILEFGKKRNRKIFTKEIIEYSTVVTEKKSLSIRKKIDEVIIHEYFPLPQRNLKTNHNHERNDNVMRTYDLLQPVTDIAEKKLNNRPVPQKRKIAPPKNNSECDINIPKLTYESHNYNKAFQIHQAKDVFENYVNFQIINSTSLEKSPSSKKQRNELSCNSPMNFKNSNKKSTVVNKNKYTTGGVFTSTTQNSYSIHFTDTELQSGFNTNEINTVPLPQPLKSQSDIVAPMNEENHFSMCTKMDSIIANNFGNTEREIMRRGKFPKDDGKSQTSHCIPMHFSETASLQVLEKTQHKTPFESDAVVPINEETLFGSMYKTMDSIVPNKYYDNTAILNTGCKDINHGKSLSHSIHFTETELQLSLLVNQHYILEPDAVVPTNEQTEFGSTYTIIDSSKILNNNDNTRTQTREIGETSNFGSTGNVAPSAGNIHCDSKETCDHQSIQNENTLNVENNNCNVVFVSTSQYFNGDLNSNGTIDMNNMCEVILGEQSSGEYHFIFDSINKVLEDNNGFKSPVINYTKLNKHNQGDQQGKYDDFNDGLEIIDKETISDLKFNFNIKNRRRYIPKGLSPIFENCNSKKVCTYEIDEDYFEKHVYNNFAQDVQVNTEIFEPMIQDIKEIVSKDIEKVNSRLNKENACLTFNTNSLKEAEVLGQVDHKFIATKIKDGLGRNDHFVLFDQHAVHERIRLETNMTEYLKGDQWKSAALEGISLHLSKDDILYLHNCKDKFYKLGLQWNILNGTEVVVTAIPEAIFGKNIRQVDVVLKAVKILIKEVISMIKEQGGCVSVYPKSIMDLVFSEACRYAIMFGDALTTDECISLLNALSDCKTPFQCAHGRPVMAVIMDLKAEKRQYKVNFARIQQFQRRVQKLNK